jgi:dolichol-phosphate mannosyltransferase
MKSVAELRCPSVRGLRSQDVSRLAKFCVVGLSGVGVGIGTLKLFTDVVGLHYVVSALISQVTSVTSNFTLNRVWTFRDRPKKSGLLNIAMEWFKYLLSSSLALGVNLAVLALLTEVFGLYYIVSALCAIAVATPLNFLASNFWVWRRSPEKSRIDLPKER